MVDMGGTIPGGHLCRFGLLMAFHGPELLGAPLFRSPAEFGRDSIRINQLLGEARFAECDGHHKSQVAE
jgi:hypothetical protein